jgi:hypothetical protein
VSPQKPSSIRKQISIIRQLSAREMKAHERREKVTELIVQDLKSTGQFFKTPERLFYFDRADSPRVLPIEVDSIALGALIQGRYGINKAERREFEHIISGLENEAYLNGEEVEIHRLAHYDNQSERLYVSRFDGSVHRLDGRQIRLIPNGTDAVFFWDNPSWKPYELIRDAKSIDVFQKLVTSSANFGDSGGLTAHEQQWLFSVWCYSQFFGSLHPTKPLLLTCGEKGGGKTLALRKWLKLLFGEGADVTALERSKPDGFVAAVCSLPIAVFDNVDEHVSWLPDHLAQLATGITFRRRKYYTTNQSVEFRPQCFVALTSRTPKFIEGRDDVLDRTLILQTERRRIFLPEEVQLAQIAKTRNLLWTELLRNLNRVVAQLKEGGSQSTELSVRMADFARFALTAARADGLEQMARRILETMESRRTEMLLSEEPISICLEKWLQKPENVGRAVTSADLNRELGAIAGRHEISWPYKSAHALGQRLSHITTNLEEKFEVQIMRDSSNVLSYAFKCPSETLKRSESHFSELQAA